jgi:hypothetical protein
MSIFLNINDFKGRYRISTSSYNQQTFQDYIDQIEEQVIIDTFDLAFYLDAETTPTKDKFTDLLENGYKEYLLGSVYFYYMRDNFTPTSTGNVKLNNSNSTNIPDGTTIGISKDRYNLGVSAFNTYTTDFLNENAVKSELIDSTIDLGGGQYRLFLNDIEYLYANDTITIDKVDYTVQSVNDLDSSVVILANEDLSGRKAIWLPFCTTYYEELEYITPL